MLNLLETKLFVAYVGDHRQLPNYSKICSFLKLARTCLPVHTYFVNAFIELDGFFQTCY